MSSLVRGPSRTPRTRRAMGSSHGARLVARPAGLSRREKYLWRTTSNPHALQKSLQIARAKCQQVPRDVQAAPVLAQKQELPGSRIGHLDHQSPAGTQQLVRRLDVGMRFVEVLQDVEHRDGPAALRQRRARGRDWRRPPARHAAARLCWRRPARNPGPPQARRPAPACSGTARRRSPRQEPTPVSPDASMARLTKRTWSRSTSRRYSLFQPVRPGRAWFKPIIGRVIAGQFLRLGLGKQPDQAAAPAFDDLEHFIGGLEEPVGGLEQNGALEGTAGRAGLRRGFVSRAPRATSRSPSGLTTIAGQASGQASASSAATFRFFLPLLSSRSNSRRRRSFTRLSTLRQNFRK